MRVKWADVEAALSKGEAPATEADIAATVTRIYGGGR